MYDYVYSVTNAIILVYNTVNFICLARESIVHYRSKHLQFTHLIATASKLAFLKLVPDAKNFWPTVRIYVYINLEQGCQLQ